VLSALLVGVLLVGAGVVTGAVWFDTKLHRERVLAEYPERPGPGRGTNWLIVGSDSRQDLSAEQQQDLATGGDIGDGRTDTILLVHVPGVGSAVPATMVSIPRDSYVPIPDHGKEKSTPRSRWAAHGYWPARWNRRPACASIATPRSGSAGSPRWWMRSAG